MHSGWEQPNWFALPGDEAGYKPSFRRTNWFTPVGREVQHVMEHCGVIDLTPFGKIEISGPDAHTFLDQICANVVPKVWNLDISSWRQKITWYTKFNVRTCMQCLPLTKWYLFYVGRPHKH